MTMDRRHLLRSGLMLGMALTGPMAIWGCVEKGQIGQATGRQMDILASVGDLVFPKTDTPAASALRVPAFVALALTHGLDGTTQGGGNAAIQGAAEVTPHTDGLWVLEAFEQQLDKEAGGDFVKAAQTRKLAALTAIDTAAFAQGGDASPWRKIKDLIVIGYYTSEAGATQELQYELVPGRWEPDIPLPADNRSWSSDWTAKDFG